MIKNNIKDTRANKSYSISSCKEKDVFSHFASSHWGNLCGDQLTKVTEICLELEDVLQFQSSKAHKGTKATLGDYHCVFETQ